MSPIEHNSRRYGIIRGSDVQRDGMYLELWSASRPDIQLFEVFYSDMTHQMQFSAFSQEDIPIEVVEEFLRRARTLLPPSPENAEPCAPPNGGPATPPGNSGVTEGPPSVS